MLSWSSFHRSWPWPPCQCAPVADKHPCFSVCCSLRVKKWTSPFPVKIIQFLTSSLFWLTAFNCCFDLIGGSWQICPAVFWLSAARLSGIDGFSVGRLARRSKPHQEETVRWTEGRERKTRWGNDRLGSSSLLENVLFELDFAVKVTLACLVKELNFLIFCSGGGQGVLGQLPEAEWFHHCGHISRFTQVHSGVSWMQQGVRDLWPVLLPVAASPRQEGETNWSFPRALGPHEENCSREFQIASWRWKTKKFKFCSNALNECVVRDKST